MAKRTFAHVDTECFEVNALQIFIQLSVVQTSNYDKSYSRSRKLTVKNFEMEVNRIVKHFANLRETNRFFDRLRNSKNVGKITTI